MHNYQGDTDATYLRLWVSQDSLMAWYMLCYVFTLEEDREKMTGLWGGRLFGTEPDICVNKMAGYPQN